MIVAVRAMLVIAVLAVGCAGTLERHPRATIVVGATAIGAIAFGLPLANECVPSAPGDCGPAHDAAYVAASAAVGAVIGLWIQHQFWQQDAGRRAAEAARAKPKR